MKLPLVIRRQYTEFVLQPKIHLFIQVIQALVWFPNPLAAGPYLYRPRYTQNIQGKF